MPAPTLLICNMRLQKWATLKCQIKVKSLLWSNVMVQWDFQFINFQMLFYSNICHNSASLRGFRLQMCVWFNSTFQVHFGSNIMVLLTPNAWLTILLFSSLAVIVAWIFSDLLLGQNASPPQNQNPFPGVIFSQNRIIPFWGSLAKNRIDWYFLHRHFFLFKL